MKEQADPKTNCHLLKQERFLHLKRIAGRKNFHKTTFQIYFRLW